MKYIRTIECSISSFFRKMEMGKLEISVYDELKAPYGGVITYSNFRDNNSYNVIPIYIEGTHFKFAIDSEDTNIIGQYTALLTDEEVEFLKSVIHFIPHTNGKVYSFFDLIMGDFTHYLLFNYDENDKTDLTIEMSYGPYEEGCVIHYPISDSILKELNKIYTNNMWHLNEELKSVFRFYESLSDETRLLIELSE